MDSPSTTFFLISMALSYFIITSGNFFFEGWMVIAVPLFALWLTVPVFFNEDKESTMLFSYIVWVIVQWAIYYYGLGPPDIVPGF